MKNLVAVVFTAVLVVAAGGIWFWVNASSNPQSGGPGMGGGAAPLVSLTTVAYQPVQNRIEAVGTLVSNESVTITSKVADIVSRVHFSDGDLVEAGAILVELTNQEQSALLAEATANLNDTRMQLNRLETLGANVASASQIDEARSRYAANQARLDAIIARMDDRLIRAPFAGSLGFREVSPGTLASPGVRITTLDDISSLKLDFTVPETVLSVLRVGDNLAARSAAYPDELFEGVVASIGSRIDPTTRSVQVRAVLENPGLRLRPGMLMTLVLVADEREAMVVPEAAVVQRGELSFVYVADSELRVREQEIRLERRVQGGVIVSSGLLPGDRIVVDGIMSVRNGALVRVIGDQENTRG